jgi:hypothetical protein
MPSKKTQSNILKSWGIYTYIAGDNNLSDAGLIDIQEMEKAGASKDVHVAIQIDTKGDHTGSVRYEIAEPDFEGISHRMVIERLPEENTGDPRYLANFASWAAKRYPAKNRLLVVWNHGAGFMHTHTRDIGYDDSSKGDALTMWELRWALEKAGFGSGAMGKLAILCFDACLMNMVEVAYEFIGLTDYVVGSQQTEPGDGWPYGDVIAGMNKNPDAKTVAANIVDVYIKSYKKTGTSGVTQSALDIDLLSSVGKAVDDLGSALLKVLESKRGDILGARIITQGYEEPTYVDLVDMVKNISTKVADVKVKSACAGVTEAVKKAVITNGWYGGAVSRSSGLSIWYPLLKSDYAIRRSEYVALRFTKDYKNWSRFLDALLAG